MNKCEQYCLTIKRMANASGGGLPPEYQQVEYLQSDGNAYLYSSAFGLTSAHRIEVEAIVTSVSSTSSHGGAYIFGYPSKLQIGYYNGGVTVGGNIEKSYSLTVGNTYTFALINDSLYIDSVATNIGRASNAGGDYLFWNGASSDSKIGIIKSVKKYDSSDNIILDMYPCYRKSDNKPGMYDIVTNTFFTNAGTGEFGVGGATVSEHTRLLTQFNGNFVALSSDGAYTPTLTGNPTFTTGYFSWTQAAVITNNNIVGYYDLDTYKGDFTIDFFEKCERARDVSLGLLGITLSNNSTYGGLIRLNSLSDTVASKTPFLGFTVQYNTWNHIAITRQNNVFRAFKNGVLQGDYIEPDAWNVMGNVRVSSVKQYNEERTMLISNLRLSDVALHEENNGVYTFPVPTRLYTN